MSSGISHGETFDHCLQVPPPVEGSALYEISARADRQNRHPYRREQGPAGGEICDGPATGTAAYMQPDVHRVRADPGVFDVAEGHDVARGLPRGGDRVRGADDLHLRGRAADLPEDRSADRGTAGAEADRLYLHECDLDAEKNARIPRLRMEEGGGIVGEACRPESEAGGTAGGRPDFREGGGGDSKGPQGQDKAGDRAQQLDVLERAPGRAGANARFDRGTRRRFQRGD